MPQTNLPSASPSRIALVSDIHYASPAEQARQTYFIRGIRSPGRRLLLRAYRRFVWLRDPFAHNHLLDAFIARNADADLVIANGDYSCDSMFVGVCDDAAFASAAACLEQLRAHFGDRFLAIQGDHELGKASMGGGLGGPRLASYHRAVKELRLAPFWQRRCGRYVLMGLSSTLASFPVFEPEARPEERDAWQQLHQQHLTEIGQAFGRLKADDRVLLFCHDPTALPFLWREPAVRAKLHLVERTVIGHLHTRLVLFKSRLLAGMPVIRFLGNTTRRLSTALHEARHWKPFHLLLCPALAGIELLNDGGYYTMELDPNAANPVRFTFHPLPR